MEITEHSLNKLTARIRETVLTLPINASFLRRIDLREIDTFVKKKNLQIVEEKIVRVRARYVESEMVDELHLLFLPFGPAVLADLFGDTRAELGRKRCEA